jgi:hypothetical protein
VIELSGLKCRKGLYRGLSEFTLQNTVQFTLRFTLQFTLQLTVLFTVLFMRSREKFTSQQIKQIRNDGTLGLSVS